MTAPSPSTSHPAQTVVGYQELATESSGNVMLAPTFLKVSESNTVTLADLKVTGYNAPWWDTSGKRPTNKDGCTGAKFALSILTTQGTTENMYYWLDYMTGADTKIGPGWFSSPAGSPIEGGEGSVELAAGKSLWIQGSGLSLQPTGAVNPFDIEFKTADSGNVAVGNCTPVDLKLSDLTVTGYNSPWWDTSGKRPTNKDGCTGAKFALSFLTTQGTTENMYYWLDYMTGADTKVGPGWFASPAGSPIEGGADSIAIPAGKGLWVQGSGLSLIVPAPEL